MKASCPALIISNEEVNKTGDVIVVMITSKPKADIFSIVIENKQLTAPLPFQSFIRCNRIVTLDATLIFRRLCIADKELVDEAAKQVYLLATTEKETLQ